MSRFSKKAHPPIISTLTVEDVLKRIKGINVDSVDTLNSEEPPLDESERQEVAPDTAIDESVPDTL